MCCAVMSTPKLIFLTLSLFVFLLFLWNDQPLWLALLGTVLLAILAQLVLFVTMAWMTCKTKEDVKKLWQLFLADAHLVVRDTRVELAQGAEEAKRLAQEKLAHRQSELDA